MLRNLFVIVLERDYENDSEVFQEKMNGDPRPSLAQGFFLLGILRNYPVYFLVEFQRKILGMSTSVANIEWS